MKQSMLSRRDALKIGGAAAGAMLLPAGLSAAADDVTVTFWNGGFTIDDPADKTKSKDQFYIYQAISRFEAANPGVKIEMENLPTDTSMFVKYRTASVAQNGPDLMALWSGTYMLSLREFIEPMGPNFSADERARILGWESVNVDFDPNSPDIYGVPHGTDGTTAFFYNVELMTKAGIDPQAGWASNIDEFLAALETIKNGSGATPIAFDNYGYVWHVLFYWIAQTIGGSSGIGELARGERKFNDPVLVNIVEGWQKLAPYVVEGTPTMDGSQALQLLFAEEAVMTTGGVWVLADGRPAMGDNLGMAKVPDFAADAPITHGGIGGPGNCFIISNYSKNKDAALSFIKFMMSKDEQIEKAKSGQGTLINVTDVDATQYYPDPLKKVQQEWGAEPSTIFWPDNTLQADLTLEINAQAQLAWTGDLSAADFLQALDDKRDSLLGA